MKRCGSCKQVKKSNDFYKDKHKKSGLSSHCKDCIRLYKEANKESIRSYVKEYEEKNSKEIAKRKQDYYYKNKEVINKRNSNYRKANKAKSNTLTRKYQADKLKRTPSWLTPHDYKVMESKYAMAAWLSAVVGRDYHVDHTIPLRGKNVSGLHVPDNLRIIPAKDNLEKGNKYG